MRLSFVIAGALAITLAGQAAAQTPLSNPTVRTVLDVGSQWVNGIAVPASDRFIAYVQDSTITVHNRGTGRKYAIRAVVAQNDNSAIAVSRSGNLLTFARSDDANGGPFVWTQALDSLTGEPRGTPRRISVVKSRESAPSSDGRLVAFIADDGNHNAVTGGTRLIVVPATGGTERVLDSAPNGLGQPRWSADGEWIYYEKRPRVMRVSSRGGAPVELAETGRFIDVSPDGKHLAFYSGPTIWNQGDHTLNVARVDGTIIARLTADVWWNRPFTWSASGQSLLAVNAFKPARMRSLPVAGGTASNLPFIEPGRQFTDMTRMLYSPDGKRLALLEYRGDEMRGVVYHVASRTKREFIIPSVTDHWDWSPDGRYLSYLTSSFDSTAFQDKQVHLLDVTTGVTRRLGRLGNQVRYKWTANSQAILFVRIVPGSAPATERPGQVVRLGLDGREEVLREVSRGPNGGTFFRILSDTLLVRGHLTDGIDAISIKTGATKRVFTGPIFGNGTTAEVLPSPDGQWIAFAVPAPAPQRQMVVVALDGSRQRRIGTPSCGMIPLTWLPGGREIFADTWDCDRDQQSRSLIPLDGAPSRVLKVGGFEEAVLAPDGKSITYSELAAYVTKITEIDFSTILRGR
jgi:Tol biopolymer transport system component